MITTGTEQTSRGHLALMRLGVALVVAALLLAACGGDDSAEADPAAVVLAYQDAMNAHDLDATVAVFAADARIVNHPRRTTDVVGEESISALNAEVLGFAAAEDAYQFTGIEAKGSTVIIGTVLFHNDEGQCFGGGDHEIGVEQGKVVLWTWGTSSQTCT